MQTMSDLTVAPLANVFICSRALETLLNRKPHLPGLACFYGPAGYGKSFSISYTARKYGAYTVAAKSHWTRKALRTGILRAMELVPERSLDLMAEQACRCLNESGRALIIDEFDHLANRGTGYIELLRDILDESQAAVLLVGENTLPDKLRRWQRFYSRILTWAEARPLSHEDGLLLARLYCGEIALEDDLLEAMLKKVKSARLMAVNLELAQATARNLGLTQIGLKAWNGRDFYVGDVVTRRRTCMERN